MLLSFCHLDFWELEKGIVYIVPDILMSNFLLILQGIEGSAHFVQCKYFMMGPTGQAGSLLIFIRANEPFGLPAAQHCVTRVVIFSAD